MGMKAGRHPDPKLQEYMRRYGISKKQVYTLGGVMRLDAMTEDARRVLANMALFRRKRTA